MGRNNLTDLAKDLWGENYYTWMEGGPVQDPSLDALRYAMEAACSFPPGSFGHSHASAEIRRRMEMDRMQHEAYRLEVARRSIREDIARQRARLMEGWEGPSDNSPPPTASKKTFVEELRDSVAKWLSDSLVFARS